MPAARDSGYTNPQRLLHRQEHFAGLLLYFPLKLVLILQWCFIMNSGGIRVPLNGPAELMHGLLGAVNGVTQERAIHDLMNFGAEAAILGTTHDLVQRWDHVVECRGAKGVVQKVQDFAVRQFLEVAEHGVSQEPWWRNSFLGMAHQVVMNDAQAGRNYENALKLFYSLSVADNSSALALEELWPMFREMLAELVVSPRASHRDIVDAFCRALFVGGHTLHITDTGALVNGTTVVEHRGSSVEVRFPPKGSEGLSKIQGELVELLASCVDNGTDIDSAKLVKRLLRASQYIPSGLEPLAQALYTRPAAQRQELLNALSRHVHDKLSEYCGAAIRLERALCSVISTEVTHKIEALYLELFHDDGGKHTALDKLQRLLMAASNDLPALLQLELLSGKIQEHPSWSALCKDEVVLADHL